MGIGAADPIGDGVAKEVTHGYALVHEYPHVALYLSQAQCTFQRYERNRDVAQRPMSERLQHQEFDDSARPLAPLRRFE